MGCPADIDNDRNVNTFFIHAGDELICGSQFSLGVGVQDGETGVGINVLVVVFLQLGWYHVGMRINNHR